MQTQRITPDTSQGILPAPGPQPGPAGIYQGRMPGTFTPAPAPGGEPTRLGPVPMSPMQLEALRKSRDPYLSEGARERHKQVYEIEEARRKRIEQQQETDFTHGRTQHEKKVEAFRQNPIEQAKFEIQKLTIAKENAQALNRPKEAEELQLKIDNAQANLSKTLRDLATPEGVNIQGTRFERGTPTEPYKVPAGLPPPEQKPLTKEQADNVQFVVRTAADLNTLEQDDGAILAQPLEAWRDLPWVGNLLTSDAYRAKLNASNNWGAGFITQVSGAAVSPSEAARNLPAFLPQTGDSKEELAEKTRRRRDFTDAVGRTSGSAGLELIAKETDRINNEVLTRKFEEHARRPVITGKTTLEAAKSLPPGQRFTDPDGNVRQVPLRPIKLPRRAE